MKFNDKLDFLMEITKTSNSTLARYLAIDASYISRLRSGKRKLPRNNEIIERMSLFFARNCQEEYQKNALKDTLALNIWPEEPHLQKDAINLWLASDKTSNSKLVTRFLGNLSAMETMSQPSKVSQIKTQSFPVDISFHYGIKGKREAALYLLAETAKLKETKTLLLFSDEETSWMSGDVSFIQQWAVLMFKVIDSGHKIKIIHTISRHLDEMLNAISQWMPLYMSGAIEPYYYPKKRDGIFRRTLFVVPGTAALVSNSVGEDNAYATNMMIHVPEAVETFEEEFNRYFALCQPLMLIFTEKDRNTALFTLSEFEKEVSKTIIKTESLSLLTMPFQIFTQLFSETDSISDQYKSYHQLRTENFLKLLKREPFVEIIKLPEIKDLLEGKVKIAMSFMMAGSKMTYTPNAYLSHLENIVTFLKQEPNYHINLIQGTVENRYMVYVKENSGAIVSKTSQPPLLLAMNESNMVASFWDFLNAMTGSQSKVSKTETIEKLQAYIDELKKHI